MRTMGIPVECPTAGPEWFVENYQTICDLLVEGKTTTEIGEALDKSGVEVPDCYENVAAALSNKVSALVRDQKFPDFPQLKGYEKRTSRRKKPTIAFSGSVTTRPTTTIEQDDATVLNGATVTKVGEKIKGFNQPRTQFEIAMQKLAAIGRVVNSSQFDEISKLKYIKAELDN